VTSESRASAPSEERQALWPLALLVGLGAVLRLAYAAWAHGMFHPDEIYQSLEPAHGVVYGTGVRAWEFVTGARPWTTPGVYVLLLGGLRTLGITKPEQYLLVSRLLNAAIAASWPWFCYRMAKALRSHQAGLLAAALTACWYFLILLAPRALNHTFSVTFVLWALARILEGHAAPSRRARLATGALLGLAFAFRYQEGLILVGVVLFLIGHRRAQALPMLLVGAAIPALAVGLLDGATWGVPFHSLFAYFQANVLEGAAARFGSMPGWFYAWYVVAALGLGAAFMVALPWAGRQGLALVLTVAGTTLVAHSLTDNKQLRFVVPAMLVLMTATACGIEAALQRLPERRRGLALVAALGLWVLASAHTASGLTFADLGIFAGQPEAAASPWDFRRDLNRALARIGRRDDLCGLVIYPFGGAAGPAHQATTGGYTTFHRAAPMTMGPLTPENASFTNYAVACPDTRGRLIELPGFAPLDVVGTCQVSRRPDLRCDASAAQAFMRDRRW
jgi:GPI mannosyltransferase 3